MVRIVCKARYTKVGYSIWITSLPWPHMPPSRNVAPPKSRSSALRLLPPLPPDAGWPMRPGRSKLALTLASGLVSFSIYIITCQPRILFVYNGRLAPHAMRRLFLVLCIERLTHGWAPGLECFRFGRQERLGISRGYITFLLMNKELGSKCLN